MSLRAIALALLLLAALARAADPPHPVMRWVKRHPSATMPKPSPRLGYESSYGYDPLRKLLIRYGGHNQGGGGEQNSETWTYDLARDLWTWQQPNDAPPGVCCTQQNVYHDGLRRFLRFRSFSGSHGWQSFREIRLKDASVWSYDLDSNTWRAMRPCPDIRPSGLRGAAYDPRFDVVVIHGGEGADHGTAVYDLYANAWHLMRPKGGPEARISQPGFAFDLVNGRHVLFGAQFETDPRTWTYDLPANRWTQLAVDLHPPTEPKEASPILCADTRNGIILCSVRGAPVNEVRPLETWVLDLAKRSWRKLEIAPPDVSGSRNRILLYLPDSNLFVLENSTDKPREQQIWTFRYAEAPTPPPAPAAVTLTTTRDSAEVAWNAVDLPDVTYTVLRAEADVPWQAQFRPIAENLKVTRFVDTNIPAGASRFYRIVARVGQAASQTPIVRTQPPIIDRLTVSVASPRKVDLAWPKAAAPDIVGYHVERAPVEVYSSAQVKAIATRYTPLPDMAVGAIKAIGPFTRLTAQPIVEPAFSDTGIDLSSGPLKVEGEPLAEQVLHKDQVAPGKPYPLAAYAYRVYAVNRLGLSSGPSPLAYTIPSAVQHVFSREEGKDRCRLKWQANPESNLKGYLVYRHDGRWDENTISLLTPRPITVTEFTDESSGTSTRRYEVVAVDALGQEGEPSQPVWSRREWQAYYVPYAGEWHQ